MKMKYIISFVVIAAFSSIIYGFNLEDDQEALADKFIGGGTLAYSSWPCRSS